MLESDKSISNQVLSDKSSSQGTIKDANEKLIALLDAAVDALVIIDGKGNVELFNSAARKMFGYSQQDVFGKNIKMLMPPHLVLNMTNIYLPIWPLVNQK
ncbi:PAS/PAC sensor signal transduction histidine kinase [Paraglaciecola psychrophila 170]|uniref:PAS/PAC sensor signal transduction histidine kinase n=1 Tax=Paraglaciecola psychrophila 170 TaxID=1129794 RepID=M4RN94_9ALTE|nr:PAS/PAC sensor signal transduction histidine kinase [Paraglaciecola psychrophila 170]